MFGRDDIKFKARGRKTWRYSMEDIAEVSGRSERNVRNDRVKGLVDPGDLRSVVRYCAEWIWRVMK